MNDNKCPWVLKRRRITEGFLEKGFIPTQRSPNRSLWPGLTGAGCPPTPALPQHCQGRWACPRVTAPTGHLASSWLQQLCPSRPWNFKGSTHGWVRGRRHESLLVDDHTTRTAALWHCPAIRHHPLPAMLCPQLMGQPRLQLKLLSSCLWNPLWAPLSHTEEVITGFITCPEAARELGLGDRESSLLKVTWKGSRGREELPPGATTVTGTRQAKAWCWEQCVGKSDKRKGPIKGLCGR